MDYRIDALALAMSQHYRMLKEMIASVYEKGSIPSKTDIDTTDGITDIVERIGGNGLANLLRLRFTEAYLSGDHYRYDIREMLEFILRETPVAAIRDDLKFRMDGIVELIYRLSNPVDKKSAIPRRSRKPLEFTQELLFPEEEIIDEDHTSCTVRDADKEKTKTRKREKTGKSRKERRDRKKIDRIADSIMREEYGEEDEYSVTIDEDEMTTMDGYDNECYGRHYDDYTGICEDD